MPLVALLAAGLPVTAARAHHPGVHLEVTPEVQTVPVGGVAIMRAVLVSSQNPGDTVLATQDTTIMFENEGGANDLDGVSRTAPDLSCVIPVSSSSCFVQLDASRTGSATFRAWIDGDRVVSTDNSDDQEGRVAGPDDCDQVEDTRMHCDPAETMVAPVPGATCRPLSNDPQQAQAPGTEPDCTDVFEVNFIGSAPGALDCDDSGPPDTEHETNPPGAAPTSREVYTCYVRDDVGNLKPGARVFGELSGTNDTDGSASYTSPDYSCDTTEDVAATTTINETGRCTIEVPGPTVTPQKGAATICFWVGDASSGADLCPAEAVDGVDGEVRTDDGDNNADAAELTWETLSDLVLDCSPESGFSIVDNNVALECEARSRFTDDPYQGVTLRAEATGANDPDESDTPQTQDGQPDGNGNLNELRCETGADGRCTIRHVGVDGGETTYRVWIDDGVPEPTDEQVPGTGAADDPGVDQDVDETEGQDEDLQPGGTDEPDATDVVESVWGLAPVDIELTPTQGSASVGVCHEVTVSAFDREGNPAAGVGIDVEQKHERTMNATPNDEPIVTFCTPEAGPNPSEVDPARGDLQRREGSSTSGTAGGETVGVTDLNGQITFGVATEPAQGSDGSGTVYLTTWWETIDNDDPNGAEPSGSGFVVWSLTETAALLDLTPDVSAADPGTEATFTATVTQNGAPIAGVEIAWASSGTGMFTWTDATTNESGQATATVTSSETGTTTVTASCAGRYECSDTSTQNWGPAMCDVVGTDDGDVLIGTDADETICGFGGDDVISGGAGDDTILGGAGDDEVIGEEGADEVFGAGGRDKIRGGVGPDEIFAGGGNDWAAGGAQNDRIYGDAGDDRLSGGTGKDRIIGGRGQDKLFGDSSDRCYGGSTTSQGTRCY